MVVVLVLLFQDCWLIMLREGKRVIFNLLIHHQILQQMNTKEKKGMQECVDLKRLKRYIKTIFT